MENLTRRDVGYTIISRTEQILRSHISTQVSNVFAHYSHAVPQAFLDVAKDRNGGDDVIAIEEVLENIDFPQLKDIIFYKNNYSYYFDNEFLQNERFSRFMEELYALRCKIAHVRGYFTSTDLDNLIEYSSAIVRNLPAFRGEFEQLLRNIEESPHHYVCRPPIDFDLQKVKIPSNIPTPDFEYEGGFIGRKEDIQKIVDMLEGDLHRVITITGAGGVGKTALAIRVLQELFKKGSNKFDGIIWLSAKENKLTYLGIEDIEPTVKNFDQLLDTVLEVMGFDTRDVAIEEKEDEVKELFNLYGCILIVVDNLETITDDKIIDFIVDAHPKSKFLITSRKGLGQVERRYELKELKEREAILLFRHIARDKNLERLASLDDDILRKYVNKLSRYPLAIKWIIGHVKLGRDIDSIIDTIHENTSDISLFCFEQIYSDISVDARNILCALSIFDGSPSSGVLMYVVNLKQNDFEDSIRELIIVSLVIPEQTKSNDNHVVTKYALLPLTQGYVRNQLDKNSTLKQQFDQRLRTVETTIEEAERAKSQYRFSLRDLGATTEEEKIGAMLAHTAYQKAESGRYEDALEDFKRAAIIAPKFGALYRNWAIVEAGEGHHMEADRLMDKASKLAPEDPILWLTWGNMKRKTDRTKEALPLLEKALQLAPDDSFILNALGNLKCRLNEHEEANSLLVKALEVTLSGGQSPKKHEIVNKSSIAENLKRWSEVLISIAPRPCGGLS